jgi:hypothetical protein
MNKIFIEDENNPKRKRYVGENILTDTITYVSDYYQIFIDDLNGEDFSILDIMKMGKKELFKKCLKLDVELTNNIYKTFSYFNYIFKINIEGIDNNSYVYFVHSYYLKADDESIVSAKTEYTTCIHASVEKGNVFACQFHPEKSSDVGLKILENFANL